MTMPRSKPPFEYPYKVPGSIRRAGTKCPVPPCRGLFWNIAELRDHLATDHQEERTQPLRAWKRPQLSRKKVTCQKCGSWMYSGNFRKHMRRQHPEEGLQDKQ